MLGNLLLTTYFPFIIQVKFNSRGFFLSLKMANDLLLAASGEKVNQYVKLRFSLPVNFSVTAPCYHHPLFLGGLKMSLYSCTDWRVYSCQPNMGYGASL